MVLTPSTMTALGTLAADFELPDVNTGKTIRMSEVAVNQPLLVIFLCRHCPYVQHIKEQLVCLGKDYLNRGITILGISSNDAAAYPDDAPVSLAAFVNELNLSFPILYDAMASTVAYPSIW